MSIWRADIIARRAFAGQAEQVAVAGQFSHVGLFLPVGASRVIIVRQLTVLNSTGALMIASSSAVLGAVSGTRGNLFLGGAAPTGEIRVLADAVPQGADIIQFAVEAGIERMADNWFARIQPGNGLVVRANTAAVGLRVAFLWSEVT